VKVNERHPALLSKQIPDKHLQISLLRLSSGLDTKHLLNLLVLQAYCKQTLPILEDAIEKAKESAASLNQEELGEMVAKVKQAESQIAAIRKALPTIEAKLKGEEKT
jgi:hypothetical protein